jgi:hypothetical protein
MAQPLPTFFQLLIMVAMFLASLCAFGGAQDGARRFARGHTLRRRRRADISSEYAKPIL